MRIFSRWPSLSSTRMCSRAGSCTMRTRQWTTSTFLFEARWACRKEILQFEIGNGLTKPTTNYCNGRHSSLTKEWRKTFRCTYSSIICSPTPNKPRCNSTTRGTNRHLSAEKTSILSSFSNLVECHPTQATNNRTGATKLHFWNITSAKESCNDRRSRERTIRLKYQNTRHSAKRSSWANPWRKRKWALILKDSFK